MPEIQPFAGLRYRVPQDDLSRVLAPPYDVIPPRYQEELYARDPRNIVRVILNRGAGEAGYAEAGETFARWRAEGLLTPDEVPGLYVLEQSFPWEGRTLRRYGLLARFLAEDPGRGSVLPHEQTRPAAKEDRYRVLRATRANFSPIFLMFPDPQSRFGLEVANAIAVPPVAHYVDDAGVGHRLWCVTEAATIATFRELLGGSRAYIADGHHRYATALRYRDEVGPEGAWTFGYFTPMGAPGLVVLPYHRILAEGPSLEEAARALAGLFTLSRVGDAAAAARAVAASTRPYAFALAEPGKGALVAEAQGEVASRLPPETPPSLRVLDAYLLHQVVLGTLLSVPPSAVSYVHSLAEAEETLGKGACRLAVLLRGTPVQQIVNVAEAGESMPAKSTFFHPKLPSGLVIHPLKA
ncbi:MAG TPA: DUF1015 domain-containing protein [Vicinamibacteria bacterium]|nr:DUF1015 domain-containing protein [Vicinamibacteria bacterium]